MSGAEKRRALQRVARVSGTAIIAARRRNEAISDALQVGASVREVARSAGLSPARIHQIRHGR